MDIDNKTVTREILKIGVPSFLEVLFTTFSNIIDSKMVSAMGLTAISAVSVTNPPRLFIISVFIALNTVLSSLTAKCVGKNDRDEANRYFDSVMKMVLIASVVLSVLSVALARPIMLDSTEMVVYIYATGVISYGVQKIAAAFRKTAIVYIQ